MSLRYAKFTESMFGACVGSAFIDGTKGDWSRLAATGILMVVVAIYVCVRWRADGESRFIVNPKGTP